MPPMTMPEQDPLAQLRDIHMPEAVSIWPPAPGWWLLAIVIIVGITYLTYRIIRHKRDNRYRKLALAQLAKIDLTTRDSAQFLQQLNRLLKQTALAAAPTTNVAGLSGQHWLHFLDQTANTSAFSEGIGKVLMHGPYQQDADSSIDHSFDKQALKELVHNWIRQHSITGGAN